MASKNTISLGSRIKVQRVNMGMTQEQLSEALYIPKSTISAYENNKVDIKCSVLLELCRVLKTSPNCLLGYDKEQDPSADAIVSIFRKIHNEELKRVLYAQIKIAAEISS